MKAAARTLVIVLVSALVVCLPDAVLSDNRTLEVSRLTIASGEKRHTFQVELAQTAEDRARGLMFRRELAPDAGMLFDFHEARPLTFWMKNTFIPLDMLFIGADGSVLNIAERTVPQSLAMVPSAGAARAVLEINAGLSSRLGIRPGDRVLHPIFANAK